MTLRCKVGDLVVVVSPLTEIQFIGRFMTVVRMCEHMGIGYWRCEPNLRTRRGLTISWRDQALRPIRPNDGADETLTWAGAPSDVETLYEALESMRSEP